ncbi:MAG: hypothetical protein WC479_08975 [Candidatus Izemoplasmatales bacterium]
MKVKELVKAFSEGRQNEAFGIQETVGEDNLSKSFRIDEQAIPVIQNASPRQIARDLLGSSFESQLASHFARHPHAFQAVQETGGIITASDMSPINTFTALTAGLFGAQVKVGWQLLDMIFPKFVNETTATVYGGHKIPLAGMVVGDTMNTALKETQKAPMIGAAPFWLWTQQMETRQCGFQMTLESILSDVNGATSELQNLGASVGYELKRQQNRRALELLFGRTNTYCVNNKTDNTPNANTYQKTAGTGILNFINSGTGLLSDAATLNTAYNVLAANKHPINPNWRLGFDKTLRVFVHPTKVMETAQIIHQLQAWRAASGLATSVDPTTSANALILAGYKIEVEDFTYYGHDVLTSAGTNYDGSAIAAKSAADAAKAWIFLGDKQVIRHENMQALTTRTLPLTGDDILQRIVWKGDGLLIDNFVVEEPRYSYFGGNV